MQDYVFYLPVATPVMRHVRQALVTKGAKFSDAPDSSVTHLLLGVPSLEDDGSIKNGGSLAAILTSLPDSVTVAGGSLDHPILEGYRKMDLLKNETYLWENAAITADCAISIARQRMQRGWRGTDVLITGFGRIGFHLARMLSGLGAGITVCARSSTALAQAASLGMDTVHTELVDPTPCSVIFNTVPAMVLPEDRCGGCQPDCIKIDLASRPGIGGNGVIWARGLPGKYAPESSGELIAGTILQEIRR